MQNKPKSIEVKILRAEKRGRKIIVVFESDLYSDEVFAVTPFYDEGDAKNQLQETHFVLNVSEKSGNIKANVSFTGAGTHYTKGHFQLHDSMNRFFISKKDCAINWAMTEKEEWLNDSNVKKVLDMWKDDVEMQNKITEIISERKNGFKLERLNKAKENYHAALRELEEAMGINKLK